MTFRFLPAAEVELLEGISYYSAIRRSLGHQFQQAVEDTVHRAVANPERGAPRSRSTRRWLVAGFPFGIIDRVDNNGVLIVAVAHQRRMPEYWLERIG